MRAITILLALSLAVNVFLGGFIAGRMIGRDGVDGRHGPRPGHGPALMRHEPLAAAGLSERGRAALTATFEADRRAMRESFRETQRLGAAAAEALGAEPFDRARAEAAFARLQEADAAVQRKFAILMIEAAEKLSAEDRKALAGAHTILFETKRGGMRKRLRGGPANGDVLVTPPPGAPLPPEPEMLPLEDSPPQD